MSAGGARRLVVLVDGAPLEEEAARALWARFSAWMEEHRGDLAGFAAEEGYASIHPGVDGDRPVLVASKTARQQPYSTARTANASANAGQPGGSAARQSGARKPDRAGNNPRHSAGKRHR